MYIILRFWRVYVYNSTLVGGEFADGFYAVRREEVASEASGGVAYGM